jgi:O-methyltransferase
MANRVYIFGFGDIGNNIVANSNNEFEILGFLDNNSKLWNKKMAAGLTVYNPEKVLEGNFDAVIVASTGGFKEIPEQLMKMGVSRDKIILDYALIPTRGRIIFLEKLAEMLTEKNIGGAVAEGGVYRGNFSCEINRVFPDKKSMSTS